MAGPRVTVLTPVHGSTTLLARALASLRAQAEPDWELVVIDDGAAADLAEPVAAVPGARLLQPGAGRGLGLGAALNSGLDAARAPVVAYLPADDAWAASHLATLLSVLDAAPAAVAAVAPMAGAPDPVLQLVQVAHRLTADRWTERAELESDDLGLLFWDKLRARGPFAAAGGGVATCVWTHHPGQRHRAFRESCDGGLNVFRRRYGVAAPLRFHSSETGLVDEVARYAPDRAAELPHRPGGLRILLAGELAFNPDRVLALAERGHTLAGLWIDNPLGFNTVGPLPFGHARELGDVTPREAVRAFRPDVVYALLNWRAVPLAHALLDAGAPVVWHFKEAPQRSLARGEWPLLAALHARAAGVAYATALQAAWFEAALPGARDPKTVLVLDGDLPRARWLAPPRSPRLSAADGAPHVALLGRIAGMDRALAGALAAHGVHLHLHGVARTPANREWLAGARAAAGDLLHEHPPIGPEDWVRVLSAYDGGLLHRFSSANGGDVRIASWDDLNQPARVPTLLAGGVALLQAASPGAAVHMQDVVAATGAGVLYRQADELAAALASEVETGAAGRRAWAVRDAFTFDHHVEKLERLLRAAA